MQNGPSLNGQEWKGVSPDLRSQYADIQPIPSAVFDYLEVVYLIFVYVMFICIDLCFILAELPVLYVYL